MTRRNRWRLAVIGLLLGAGAAAVRAETPPAGAADPVDQMLGRYHLNAPIGKLGRGVSNALAGWMEIPLNVGQHRSESDTGGSFFTGLGYGVIKAAVRTAVGVYETVTFLIPYPEDYAPILPTLPYFQAHRSGLPYE